MSSEARSRRLLVGVRIEGIGQDTSKQGLALYYSWGAPPQLPGDLSLEWRQGLTRPPQGVSSSVDVWTSRWQISAISLTVSYAHAPRLLGTQTVTTLELTDLLTASATDVELSAPVADGATVWIEDEAILLGTWDGIRYQDCVRGLWGSTAAPHTLGQPVYIRPAYWQHRIVELWTLDLDSGQERLRWRGYLTKRQTSSDGLTIELGCEEYFATWRRAEANREPRDLNAGGGLQTSQAGALLGKLRDADGDDARVGTLIDSLILDGTPGAAVQVAGAILPLRYTSGGRAYLDSASNRRLGGELKVEAADARSRWAPYTEPAWEIVVWDRPGDLGRPADRRPISPTWGIEPEPWHPLRIAQILLRADGEGDLDPLTRSWGLGLKHIDWSAWDAEIEASPALTIDQLALGVDGKPYRPLEVVEGMLRALGYYLAPQLDTRLTIRRLRTLTLEAYAEARGQRTTIYPGTLELVPAPDVGLTEMTAVVGETPYSAPRRVRISAYGSSPRAAYLGDARRWEVDLPYWRQSEAVRLALELAEGAALIHYALPKLRVRVPDPALTGIDCSIGRHITIDAEGLQTPWFLDRAGQLVKPADMATRVDLVGLVVGVRIRWEDMSHELDLLLIAWHAGAYTRERAPAGEIVAVSGYDLEIETALDDPSGDDAGGYWPGDSVGIYSHTGALLEGPYNVLAVYPGGLTLDAAPAASEGTVRLAESSHYANAARYDLEPRPYVYLADAGAIARPTGEDEPDIYGAGLGVG